MYFLFFKLHSWGERFGSSRRRFIQRFPNPKIIKSTAPIGGVFQMELKWFNLKTV